MDPACRDQSEQGARQQHAGHGKNCSKDGAAPGASRGQLAASSVETNIPSQQRDKQDIRAGCRLGERNRGIELVVLQPVVLIDQCVVDIRDGRNRPPMDSRESDAKCTSNCHQSAGVSTILMVFP
jgi:hypothetical protein